jgi:hypothetical protein
MEKFLSLNASSTNFWSASCPTIGVGEPGSMRVASLDQKPAVLAASRALAAAFQSSLCFWMAAASLAVSTEGACCFVDSYGELAQAARKRNGVTSSRRFGMVMILGILLVGTEYTLQEQFLVSSF